MLRKGRSGKLHQKVSIFMVTVFMLTQLIFVSPVLAATMTLVSSGTSYTAIIKPVGCSEPISIAAEQLQSSMYKMTNVTVPIYTSDQTPSQSNWILIGISSKTQALGISSVDEGKDGFIIKTFNDNRIVLAGTDDRGSAYAAYHFIEKYLGCVIHYPTETDIVETVPTTSTISITAPIDFKTRPDLAVRDCVAGYFEAYIEDKTKVYEWLINNKMAQMNSSPYNHSAVEMITGMSQYGLSPHVGSHSFYYWLPSGLECHYSYSATQGWYDVHPEYFPLINSVRQRPVNEASTNCQLCVSNQAVVNLVASNIIDYLTNNPGITDLGVAFNDVYSGTNEGWCECAACEAMDDPSEPASVHSTRNVKFVNSVAEIVGEEFPDVKLITFAYGSCKPAPYVQVNNNVKIGFTCMGRCYKHSLSDPSCTANSSAMSIFRSWIPYTNNIFIYDYYYWLNWRDYPAPLVHTITQDVKDLRNELNRVSNPSFENTPIGWNTHQFDGTYEYSIDPFNNYFGSKSAKIECTSPGQGRWYQLNIPVIEGGKYRIRAKVKTSPTFSGSFVLMVVSDGNYQQKVMYSTGGQWKDIYIDDYIAGGTVAHIYLNYLDGTGTVWIDDVVMEGDTGIFPEFNAFYHEGQKLNYAAWTNAHWNSEISAETVLSEFCNKFYGNAGTDMYNYWNTLENAVANKSGCFYRSYLNELGEILTPTVRSNLSTYLSQAEACSDAAIEPYKSRIMEDRVNNDKWCRDIYIDATATSWNDSQTGSSNWLVNPGFENGSTSWTYNTMLGQYNYSIVTDAWEGTNAAKIECVTEGMGRWYKTLEVREGSNYTAKVRYKTPVGSTGIVKVWVLDGTTSSSGNKSISIQGTNGQWKQLNIYDIIPNSDTLNLYLSLDGGGSVIFDSIYLGLDWQTANQFSQDEISQNVLSNPGFENGITGWNTHIVDGSWTFPVDTTTYFEGTNSIKLACTSPGWARIYRPVTVTQGSTYKLRFRCKTQGTSGNMRVFTFITLGPNFGAYLPDTGGEWKQVEINNIVPEGNQIYLYLNAQINSGSGNIWFDDVYFGP